MKQTVVRLVAVCRCGTPFNVRRRTQAYCCKKCKMRFYMRDRRTTISLVAHCCNPHCGKTMKVPVTRSNRQRYCSTKCRVSAWREKRRAA